MKIIILIACVLVSFQLYTIQNVIKDINSYKQVKTIPYVKKYKVLDYSSSPEDIKQAVIQEFGTKMAQIVQCESNFRPSAYNPHNKNGTKDSGLFQINSTHKSTALKMGIDLDTIQGQFEYAKHLVDKNGYKDWVCAKKLKLI